jgi:hypothetical protein
VDEQYSANRIHLCKYHIDIEHHIETPSTSMPWTFKPSDFAPNIFALKKVAIGY